MRTLAADLHIHTCLSPCADNEMSPLAVARRAKEAGLDLIAVCDHNSSENVRAVKRAGKGCGLAVIAGMEVTSREEVHVLGLFDEDSSLSALQETVHEHLAGENDPETFGEQLIMNHEDEVIGESDRLLIGATSLALEEIVKTIHDLGGIAIASHVDRPSFSVISQLGFIPDGLGLDAVEVCADVPPGLPDDLPIVFSSDAHRHGEIGARRTRFLVEDGTAAEVAMALRQEGGRGIVTGR